MNSNAKGKRGERELAKELTFYGYTARRSQQYCGANGDADVIGLPHLHIECKRVERLQIENAMRQSLIDKKPNEIACVMHRKNNYPWLVTLTLRDFMEIYKEFELNKEEETK
jgi:Holliday junction resolvase